MRHLSRLPLATLAVLAALCVPSPAAAAERLCDVAFEDCRAPLLDLINNESQGIDVAFWFMEDQRYSTALINRWKAGVPVRVLMDTEANAGEPANATILQQLKDAGIPMREKTSGGILHWKVMLFAGQNTVQFSGANYSSEAYVPITPYSNYVDEVIYFSDDPSIVNSFKTRYDDAWTDTTLFSNYGNITGSLVRTYPTYPIDPQMNFVPWNDFAARSVGRYNAETQKIDAIMYRITDRRHTDALIAAKQRGVQIRLITEQLQYRDPTRMWDAWNVDRMYMAGIQIHTRAHEGLSHEKFTVLYGQQMAIFGSSNWSGPSADSQHEANIFTTKPWFFQWGVDHFERKWNNLGPSPETEPFVPLPPDKPFVKSPADGASNQSLTPTLMWNAGPWGQKYDVLFGTSPSTLSPILTDSELGPCADNSCSISFAVPFQLQQSTTYYWKVVARTMANLSAEGPVWSFRTQGPPQTAGANDVVLWAKDAPSHPGWVLTGDTSAAGGTRLANADAGATVGGPLASPTQYFDLGFTAQAGIPYRIWIRGKATRNDYSNDSVYVQFSDSVTSSGAAQWRIGTAAGTTVQIEDCPNCGLAGWGWNDNGYGTGVLGPTVYFQNTGDHVVRVQVREDGLSIDQIILSPDTFMNTAPGLTQNDGNIYQEQGTAPVNGVPPPPPPSLPDGWNQTDIGAPSAAGDGGFTNNVFTVSGSGADIWGTSDQFHYVYTQLNGDGSMIAKVTGVQGTDLWAKAGVMMRESTSAGSKHATMFISYAKGAAFQRRAATSGSSTNTAGPAVAAPYWVKLDRSGNTFTASVSSNGSSWTVVGTDTITMASNILVGLAVTSHVNGTLNTSTFSNVTLSSSAPPPPPPPPSVPPGWSANDIGATSPAGSTSWNSSTGVFTISGSGADIWGSADAFHYASTTLTGDGEIVARVASVQNVDIWTKAGVMMRDGTAPGASHMSMFVTPSTSRGTASQYRILTGGATANMAGPVVAPPYWVRVTRVGSTFTSYASSDGVHWTTVTTQSIGMGATINVGLAVTSHQNGSLATATIDNVAVIQH